LGEKEEGRHSILARGNLERGKKSNSYEQLVHGVSQKFCDVLLSLLNGQHREKRVTLFQEISQSLEAKEETVKPKRFSEWTKKKDSIA